MLGFFSIGYAVSVTSLVASNETLVPPSDVSSKISIAETTYNAGQSITLKLHREKYQYCCILRAARMGSKLSGEPSPVGLV